MSEIIVVQGEHPYDPYYPLELFASEDSAAARCAELTRDFLQAFWEIEHEDTPLIPMPEVTIENWSELVDEHGDTDAVQDDGFGRWWIGMDRHEVKP